MKKDLIELEINPDEVFDLPLNVSCHKIRGKYLIIAPTIPSWLSLSNVENDIFNLFLKKKTVSQVLKMKKYSYEDVIRVVAAIKLNKFNSKIKGKIRKKLFSATLYLTNDCNLRCVHCYMFSGCKKEIEIDYLEWFKVIDILKSNGVKVVTLTGGEPMFKKGFFEILDYLYQKNISVILITNGTLITDENYLCLSEKCAEIQISLDGPNQETHERIRGKGTFEKTIAAIELLANTKIKLFIAMTPTPDTIDAFDLNFSNFMKSFNFLRKKNVHINITADLEEGRNISEVNRFKGSAGFYDKVKKIVNSYIEVNRLEKREMLALVPGEKKLNCGFGESFTVLWDGTVKRCLKDHKKFKLLHLDCKTNLRQLFNREFLMTSVDHLSECNNCDLKYICGGSCRVENLQKNGSIKSGGCNIKFKKHLYELLIKFDENQFEVL